MGERTERITHNVRMILGTIFSYTSRRLLNLGSPSAAAHGRLDSTIHAWLGLRMRVRAIIDQTSVVDRFHRRPLIIKFGVPTLV